jgi:hypothetical protein
MKFAIHKIILSVLEMKDGCISLRLPVGIRILYAREQHNQIAVWYETPVPHLGTNHHEFRIVGTGFENNCLMNHRWRNIGVAILEGGNLVLHVYHNGESL